MRGLTSLLAPSNIRSSQAFLTRSYCTTTKNANKYEHSLLLPKTTLPMYHSAAKEKELIHDPSTLYKWQQQNETNGKTWVTHDGPPYANGDLHLGHVFNKVLKDFVNRYKLLTGHQVSYVPGWDCHGLPIEIKAMEKLRSKNKDSKGKGEQPQQPQQKLSAMEIRKHARDFAMAEVNKQKSDFMTLGVMGEWDNSYRTLDPEYCATQLKVFYSMYNKGFVFRGFKPVHWSWSSRTALADAELEYNDNHVSPSVYVKFPVSELALSAQSLAQYPNLNAVIWTTTPWTLPANLAISVSPSIEYCVLKWNDAHYLVAKERVEFLKEKLKSATEQSTEEGEIVATINGANLELTQCIHPLFGRQSPILLSSHVTTTAGTGLVHTAPGHGEEDFAVGKKYNLSVLCPVDENGNFTPECGDPSLVGKNVLTPGNKMVIEMLSERGMLLKHEPFTHKYPYDWRTKKPVIVRSTAQWFVDLSNVHEGAVQAIQNITMVPPNSRLASMVVGRSSWCISRQRVWGVPIPVFYHVKTGEALINDETINLVSSKGTDAWWNLSVSELLPPQYGETASDWRKGEDTMDVWFDSGVSWAAVLKARGIKYPT